MLKKQICQCEIDMRLELIDPVLIRAGYSASAGPDMTPVMTWRNNQKEPFFPGTSLKGMIRSHIERICRTLHDNSVCEPYEQKKHQTCNSQHIKEEIKNSSTAQIYNELCPACRMFGSLYFTGRSSISDAYVSPGTPEPRIEERNSVAIDRFTGGTVSGALFDYQVVSSGSFDCRITLRNFELYQLGLMAFALRDLLEGHLRLGSGKSRSLGRIKGEIKHMALYYYGQHDGHLKGLAEMLSETECKDYGLKRSQNLPSLAGEMEDQIYRKIYRYSAQDQAMHVLAAAGEQVPQLLFKGARL